MAEDTNGMPVRPLPDGSDVRRVRPDERGAAAAALARAFQDDPVLSWVFPDRDRRPRRNQAAFDLYLRRFWLRHDECWTTDRLVGVAAWMPPGTAHTSTWEDLLTLPGLLRAARLGVPRLMRMLSRFERVHPHEPHWYLPVIGLDPEWQGRGFGAALLRPVLERCDAERIPAYLESTSPRNRALYERHGFQAREEIKLPDGPRVTAMWREPA